MLLASTTMGACADAPITPDLLASDGQLAGGRQIVEEQPAREYGGGQSAFATGRAAAHRASVVQVDAVLASAAVGAIEDASTFSPDTVAIYLHVRASGLEVGRDVSFRWTHGEHTLVVPGELVPSASFVLAASIDVQPDQTGPWRVEVVAEPTRAGEAAEVLLSREFLILSERPSE
jgi:hypothetical protein